MRTMKMRSCVHNVLLWMVLCTHVLHGVLSYDIEYETEDTVHGEPENIIQDDDGSKRVGARGAKMGSDAKSAPVNLYPAPYCNLNPSFKNYCHHRGPGLYTYTADFNCYIQCDEWGKTYIKPCAYGTFWIASGYEPTLYNRCVGRKPIAYQPQAYKTIPFDTQHVRQTNHYSNPVTGQHVTHTQGQRITSYGNNGAVVIPPPTNNPYVHAAPRNTGPLHYNQLVNMYINGKPNLNQYVGKSGNDNHARVSLAVNQPQVHNIVPLPQPQMQPQPQPLAQPQALPQIRVYIPPVAQIQPLPPQALAQKLQLPRLPLSSHAQPQIQAPINVKPILIQPIKFNLPPPPPPGNMQRRIQQVTQQKPQQQRITLNSRFPLVANRGQGQLNVVKINTNGMVSNGAPAQLKQFNLQKQQLLARNHQLPGLNKSNAIRRKSPGLIKRNLLLQSQRAQANGVKRGPLQRLAGMRRRGNQNGLSNARRMAERKRRLQQWRQFVKNGGNRLNGQGGGEMGPKGHITTAILNDERNDHQQYEENPGDINIAEEDDGFINLDSFFGNIPQAEEEARLNDDVHDGFENIVEEVPLFDDTNEDDTNVSVDITNDPSDEVINATGFLSNEMNASSDSMDVSLDASNIPK